MELDEASLLYCVPRAILPSVEGFEVVSGCASLGAGRGRLMQQLFAESALMGVLGGAFGAALTLLGIQVFRVLAGDFPNIDSVGINGRVLS